MPSQPSIVVSVSAALALIGAAGAARASIIRDDVTESASAFLGGAPAFGAVRLSINGGVGSGTLVAPGWVLTAAHVVTNNAGAALPLNSISLSVNGEVRTAAAVVVRPGWTGANFTHGMDLALIRLASPFTTLAPVPMHFGTPHTGAHATVVGFGAFGFGSSGFVQPPGTIHAATNTLDGVGSAFFPTWSDSLMLMDFDAISTASYNRLGTADLTEIEGVPATGDSGGGTFVQVNGVWTLVGVHSFTFTNGPVASPGGYGTCAADVLVSSASDWIQGVIPAPAAASLMGCAGLYAAQRRRKQKRPSAKGASFLNS